MNMPDNKQFSAKIIREKRETGQSNTSDKQKKYNRKLIYKRERQNKYRKQKTTDLSSSLTFGRPRQNGLDSALAQRSMAVPTATLYQAYSREESDETVGQESGRLLIHSSCAIPTDHQRRQFITKSDQLLKTKSAPSNVSASGDPSAKFSSHRVHAPDQSSAGHISTASKLFQKRRIRQAYALAKHKNQFISKKSSVAAARKSGQKAADVGSRLLKYIIAHKKGLLIALLIILAVLLIFTLLTSCAQLAIAGIGALSSGSYLPIDYVAISEADLEMTRYEVLLKSQLDQIELALPDYDRYAYDLAPINHDSFMLASYLAAVTGEYSADFVRGEIQSIFEQTYLLILTEKEEWITIKDEEGNITQQEGKVLVVSLKKTAWDQIIEERLDVGQTSLYAYYLDLIQASRYLGTPFAFDWSGQISSHYGWRVHPVYRDLRIHRGLDIGVPIGTPILAVHAGVVTYVRFSDTGYGNYIVVENAEGLRSVYAHCDTITAVLGQSVYQGEVIATAGSTGTSTGSHLHLEVSLDGRYLNPIFLIQNAPE